MFQGCIRRLAVFAATLVVALPWLSLPAAAATDQRLALVIGNGTYADAPLKNPANDARAVAASLRGRGFQVIIRENATKQQMEEAVAEFGEKLTEGATGLFFYAGHGMQVNGRNYLIPVNARITSEQRVRLEALDVDAVLDQMQAARAKVSMVILDACRNNPFERRFRSSGGGLAQINAPEGTLIAYATAPGRVAADGDGANGLYTQELLRALQSPGLKVEDVFKQVRVNVSRASNGQQVPWEASSLTGDFYFAPPAPVVDVNPLIEMNFWDTVKTSTNPAEYRAYIDKYPNGNFTPLAQARLAALTAPAQAAIPAAPPAAPLPAPAPARIPAPSAVATPPAAPQVAALPTGDRKFDGRYVTKLPHPRGAIDAVLDVVGTTMSGFSFVNTIATGGGAGICRLRGSLLPDGTIQRLGIDCPNYDAVLTGRALIDPATGRLSMDTEVKGNNWNTVRVVWEMAGIPGHIADAVVAKGAFDGRYTASFQGALEQINATIDVAGTQIAGFGAAQTAMCRISGSISPDGTVTQLGLICPRSEISFSGQFALNPATGSMEAIMVMRGAVINTRTVVWKKS